MNKETKDEILATILLIFFFVYSLIIPFQTVYIAKHIRPILEGFQSKEVLDTIVSINAMVFLFQAMTFSVGFLMFCIISNKLSAQKDTLRITIVHSFFIFALSNLDLFKASKLLNYGAMITFFIVLTINYPSRAKYITGVLRTCINGIEKWAGKKPPIKK